ncbi:hypothetical protein PHISCL_01767 [Aspergillus sclerotialis]|uniref:Zn(2)-C6 fungal-type domain-containing protein n=1 Tax=Aspergillus sclerotialis TaxID=2070753 RepID=A0A3A3A7I2_9EURO|nr:hypothetical protein PHISCL_01767 [Aspergillus sclerotialis]
MSLNENLRPLQPSGPVTNAPVQAPTASLVKQKACIPCRTRKVKCDKNFPCTSCSAWSVSCVFPSPVRRCQRPRKRQVKEGGASKDPQMLDQRLRKLESALQQLTKSVKARNNRSAEVSIQDDETGLRRLATIEGKIAELLATKDSVMVSGVNVAPELVSSSHTSDLGSLPYRLRPFGSFSCEVAPLHLSLPQVQLCWHTFAENIDQVDKVLHRPSAERILQKAIVQGSTSLTESQQALLFSIYFASISSMTDEVARVCFKMTKSEALATYRGVAEKALMSANFLTSNNLITLQAFVLFLSFNLYVDEPKFVWTMTGLARRLSSSGTSILSPFENEMRRRLRWHLWFLDQRAADDRGEDTPSSMDPDLPLNINDADLHPYMVTAPTSHATWTEMSLSLVRFELAKTSRTIDSGGLTPCEKERIIFECIYRINSKYLRYCDDMHPISWLARHVADVMVVEMRIKLHYQGGFLAAQPSYPPNNSQRDELFMAVVDIVDIPRRLETEPQARRWKWLLKPYLQFQPLAFMLLELQGYRQNREAMDHAWAVAETAFRRWSEDSKASRNGEVLSELMEKAKAKRTQLQAPMQMASWRSHTAFLEMLTSPLTVPLQDQEQPLFNPHASPCPFFVDKANNAPLPIESLSFFSADMPILSFDCPGGIDSVLDLFNEPFGSADIFNSNNNNLESIL